MVVKLLLWKACNNGLLTRANLNLKSVIDSDCYPICGLVSEDVVLHVLWNCSAAGYVWRVSVTEKCKNYFVNFSVFLI